MVEKMLEKPGENVNTVTTEEEGIKEDVMGAIAKRMTANLLQLALLIPSSFIYRPIKYYSSVTF